MSRVVEYELLSAAGSEELTAKVTELLGQGWQPYGSPFARQRTVFQAVVLTAKREKRIRKTSED